MCVHEYLVKPRMVWKYVACSWPSESLGQGILQEESVDRSDDITLLLYTCETDVLESGTPV